MISWLLSRPKPFFTCWFFPLRGCKVAVELHGSVFNTLLNTLDLWANRCKLFFGCLHSSCYLRNSWIYGCRIFIENICDFYVPNNFLFQHIAQRIRQDGETADASLRREIQTESVQLGISMQHLGAMFFELGRTMMMLRTGRSPVCIICFSFMLCN
jgi:hypothetical protein